MNEESNAMRQPGLFRRFWEGWKKVARKIGNFQARVLLFLFYFVVLAPFALLVRWASDPLAIKPKTPRGWHPLEAKEGTPADQSRRQF
jgi:hypothetical protein